MTAVRWIVDSSAIGRQTIGSPACTTIQVARELGPHRAEQLQIIAISPTELRALDRLLGARPEYARLSEADRSLLALARRYPEGILLTEDQTLRHLAIVLKLRVQGTVPKRMLHRYVLRCKMCGYLNETPECMICGTAVYPSPELKSFRRSESRDRSETNR